MVPTDLSENTVNWRWEYEPLEKLFRQAVEATVASKEQGEITDEYLDAVVRQMAAMLIAQKLDSMFDNFLSPRVIARFEQAAFRMSMRGEVGGRGRPTTVR